MISILLLSVFGIYVWSVDHRLSKLERHNEDIALIDKTINEYNK